MTPYETYIITGTAGFIGYHLAGHLLDQGHKVIGIDNVNDYYDVKLKEARLAQLRKNPNFIEERFNLTDKIRLLESFETHSPQICINLAAQAGVRYSLINPDSYVQSNLVGFANILEACRHNDIKHFLYASTSSVYGPNQSMPFKECESAEHPLTLYAATKKSNEMMAHSYSHLFDIPSTGLRFFTVYGPWGRPDMALFSFTHKIFNNQAIDIFNNGNMARDFTYVSDIVEGITKLSALPPAIDKNWNSLNPDPHISGVAPYRLVNIGRSKSENLMRYIEILEEKIGKKAIYNMLPMQEGDVLQTWADVSELKSQIDYSPRISIEEGIGYFVDWYKDYYKIDQ